MSVTKVKRKREERGGKRHNLTSCSAGFSPKGYFHVVTPLTISECSQLLHSFSCLLSVHTCFSKLGQRISSIHEKSVLKGFLILSPLQDYISIEITKECPVQSIITSHFITTPDGLFTWDYVSELIKQPELFYNKYWLGFIVVRGKDIGGWLQQHWKEETHWLTAPPSSFQRN